MEELLLKIKYSMTLDEIGEGFKLFQKKYQFKKSLVFTLVYLIALGLGIDFLIRDNTGIYGYILVGLSLGMIFYTWYKPVLIRKKLIATISSLAEETYTAEFYRDRIQITTVIEEPVIAENETETEEKTDSPAKDAALVRIENKTYGICRETGKLIPAERLRAVPHATLSIEAKQQGKK